jgi:hypothetical protein
LYLTYEHFYQGIRQTSLEYSCNIAARLLSLARFLVEKGANPNAVCSYNASVMGQPQGTALDLFASQLLSSGPELGGNFVKVLLGEGAEFSRPLQATARQGFMMQVEELKIFPEQIEGANPFLLTHAQPILTCS